MVYDPTADEVIIFGGANQFGDVLLNDIWAYDPSKNAWRNLKPSGVLPSVRAGPSMVYALVSDKVIMFGGGDMNSVLNDTWAYDPVTNVWSDLSPSGPLPPARTGQSMVYDPSTGQVIMFGGSDENGFFNDTWTYDPVANAWRNLNPSGPLPPPRSAQSMVYDSATGRVIMFGGTKDKSDLNDTWAYDPIANAWRNLNPLGLLPPACDSCLMSYDSTSDQVIMFGGWAGDKALWDTWSYNPGVNTWTKLNPSGQTLIDNHSSMVYDSSAGVAITLDGISGQTWVYKP
jgi:N-acetylneuraminic acid mutarotase